MISLLCLAAATLVGNASAISPIPHSEDSIVEFVSNNFSAFVISKYNETHEENLVATKLIRTREIALSDDVKGYYFDFDRGYMVATSDTISAQSAILICPLRTTCFQRKASILAELHSMIRTELNIALPTTKF